MQAREDYRKNPTMENKIKIEDAKTRYAGASANVESAANAEDCLLYTSRCV